tara:strand:+ start:368 stop:1207 length:840 start_codon:yes stop_codon:yes gene_type:complete
MLESRYLDKKAATELLSNNWQQNRKIHRGIRDQHVKDLASKITQGRWVVDAMETPVLIDTDGLLYNGQNRCMAVILADQGVVVQCRIETPEKCRKLYASLDLGKTRSIADITGLNNSNLVQPILYLMRCAGLDGRLKDEATVSRIADTYIGDILKHFDQNTRWVKNNRCFNSVQFKAAMAYCVHRRVLPDYEAISVLEMLMVNKEYLWPSMYRNYREQIMFPNGKLNTGGKTVANDKFCRGVYMLERRMKDQSKIQISSSFMEDLNSNLRRVIRIAAAE